MKFIYIHVTLLLLFSSVALAASGSTLTTPIIRVCEPGLHDQPNGPYAVMLFCEDALANHIGVIYKDNMSSPMDGAWSIRDRFWQGRGWVSDVTAYAWEPSGKYLLISTSAIYGSGNVYRLDLKKKEQVVIFDSAEFRSPKNEEVCMVQILSLDAEKSTVELEVSYCDQQPVKIVTVPY